MKVSYEDQQQRNSDRLDLQRIKDVHETCEPKEHLHQNYRHWAWLPKPR
jgi:hypothetical protein